MIIKALLTFRTYVPKQLEEGMLFFNKQKNGDCIIQMTRLPKDQEKFLEEHGFPLNPAIIHYDEKRIITLISGAKIGWLSEFESLEPREIEVKDFNNILKYNHGYVNIEIEDDNLSKDGYKVFLLNGKAVLSYCDTFELEEII